jgi:hypothetical protein
MNRKGMGAAILLGLKNAKEKPEEGDREDVSSGEEDVDSGKQAAAEELLSAIKEDDVDALAKALERFYSMCS